MANNNNGVTTVQFLYRRVIEETVRTSRENFLNEGIEENILQELKTLWESKLAASRVVEPPQNPSDYVSRNQVYKYQTNYGQGARNVIIQQPGGIGTQAGYSNMAAYIQQSHLQQQSMLHQQKQQQQASSQQATYAIRAQNRPQLQHPQQVTAIRAGMQNIRPGMNPQTIRPGTSMGAPIRPGPAMMVAPVRPQGSTMMAAPARPGTSAMGRPQAFPILGGVSTVTKSEFQAASGNIQVDGNNECLQVDGNSECTIQVDDNNDAYIEFEFNPESQKKRGKRRIIRQLDGNTSDEDAGEFVDDDTDESEQDSESDKSPDQEIIPDIVNAAPVEEDEPLNSGDDVSDEENTGMEETDNVVVCQYDKVQRSKNKWKLYLKDGVMHIGGKDHVFQKAVGDGEW